ncbi:MAG: RagB/SusD family nutrient uptake outer membrane protein [Marinifilaceae bacterium]
MKRNKLLYLLGLLLFFGCEDRLEIDPWQSKDDELVFTSVNTMENALTGAYDALQDDDTYGSNVVQSADLKSQFVRWTGSFTSYTEISGKNLTTSNAEARDLWIDGYDGINRANRVIDAVDAGVDDPLFESVKDRIKGEALFVRAILYFELVRNFGLPYSEENVGKPGVPLILKGTLALSDARELPTRNTIAEVYAQIIKDLKDAKGLLPATPALEGRAFKSTCDAFLVRIYMTMRNWNEVVTFADFVINSNLFALDKDPTSTFGEAFTPEMIFGVIHTTTDNLGNTNAALNDYYNPNERGDIFIPQSTLDLFPSGDKRLGWFFTQEEKVWVNKYMEAKYNTPVIRYAEILLAKGEALLELGAPVDDVLSFLNQIRDRAGLGVLIGLTSDQVVDSLRLETLREFVAEGHSVYDLQRWKQEVGFSNDRAETVPWNDPSLVFPIPQRERDVNPNLEQNEGY